MFSVGNGHALGSKNSKNGSWSKGSSVAVGWDLPAESHKADLTHHIRSASADVPGFYKVGQG